MGQFGNRCYSTLSSPVALVLAYKYLSCSDTVVIMDERIGLCYTLICSETNGKGIREGKLEATGVYRFGTERFFKITWCLLPFSLK